MPAKELTKSQEALKEGFARFKTDVAQGSDKMSAADAEKQFDAFIDEAQTKANETHHSTNTGYGAEFYPSAVQGDINLDLIYSFSSVAGALGRRYMGTNMPATYEELYLGESDEYLGNVEHTGATGTLPDLAAGQQKPQTDKLVINQRQFKKELQVSKKLAHYGPSNFIQKVTSVLSLGAAKTIDKFILNADSATSGNVNTSATPASNLYYMQDNLGIRDTAIGGSNTLDIGTLTSADIIGLMAKLGDYGADIDDMLLVVPMNVYLKMLDLDEVKTIDKFGPMATVTRGILAKIYGIDILVTNCIPSLALATGKVHASTGNDFGQIALVKRSAILHGSGDAFELTPTVIPWVGLRLTATFDYGMGVAYEKAGLGKTVALGVNVTV